MRKNEQTKEKRRVNGKTNEKPFSQNSTLTLYLAVDLGLLTSF